MIRVKFVIQLKPAFDIPPRLKIYGFRCFQDAFDLDDIFFGSGVGRPVGGVFFDDRPQLENLKNLVRLQGRHRVASPRAQYNQPVHRQSGHGSFNRRRPQDE
jgi:hypothetical protein